MSGPRAPARRGVVAPSESALFYDEVASIYDQLYSEIDVEEAVRQWRLLVRRCAKLPRPSQARTLPRLLDLGCGTGRYLAPWAAAGFSVTGVDASRRMISIARRRMKRSSWSSSIELFHSDLRRDRSVLVKNGPFDVAVGHFNFFNLFASEEISQILRTLRSCMNSGARLFTDCASPTLLPDAHREGHHLADGEVVAIRTQSSRASATVVRTYRHRASECAEKYWLHSSEALKDAASSAGWQLEKSFAWRPDSPKSPWFPWRRDATRQRVCVFLLEQ